MMFCYQLSVSPWRITKSLPLNVTLGQLAFRGLVLVVQRTCKPARPILFFTYGVTIYENS